MRRLLNKALSVLLTAAVFLGVTPISCGSILADEVATNEVSDFVERGYDLMLNRESDEEGLSFWTKELVDGNIDAAEMITQFIESPEYVGNKHTNEETVDILYNVMLNREAEEEGKAYWVNLLDTGFSSRRVVNGFATSEEFLGLCENYGIEAGMVNFTETRDLYPNITEFVGVCYISILERNPDADGINYWDNLLLTNEIYPEELVKAFICSPECSAKINSDADYIDALYRAFFYRSGEPEGIDYWTNYLKEGHSRDELFDEFMVSLEFADLLEKHELALRPTPTPTPTPVVADKMIALTFDDGPYSPVTNRILDMLEAYNGHATFFVVGDRVATYKECVLRAQSLGCEIANHTYDHKYTLSSLDAASIRWEISQCNQSIYNITGSYPKVMRPVGGAYNSTVSANVGLPMIIWNVDTQDWKNRDASLTASKILNNVSDGDIILMHDLYPSTASAMEYCIPILASQGYTFVTVSELAEAKGIDLSAGEAYYSLK